MAGNLLNTAGQTLSQTNYDVPSYFPFPNHHHLPDVFCSSNKPQGVELFDGNDSQVQGHRGPLCNHHRVKVKVRNWNQEPLTSTRGWLRAHIFALAVKTLKVGCHFESSLRLFPRNHQPCLCAFAGTRGRDNHAHFDFVYPQLRRAP